MKKLLALLALTVSTQSFANEIKALELLNYDIVKCEKCK